MSVRVESGGVFPFALRWVLLPAAGLALFTAAATVVRARTRRPSVGRMSDDWLRVNAATEGRAPEL